MVKKKQISKLGKYFDQPILSFFFKIGKTCFKNNNLFVCYHNSNTLRCKNEVKLESQKISDNRFNTSSSSFELMWIHSMGAYEIHVSQQELLNVNQNLFKMRIFWLKFADVPTVHV